MKSVVFRISSLFGLCFWAGFAWAQEATCITNLKVARLQADFQTASLICPKWKAISRVDFAWMLVNLKIIGVDDIEKSNEAGVVIFREPCASEISELEIESFDKAEKVGLDSFCINTSAWLTVPHVRSALEANGAFPSSSDD